ncbi:dethiobiotin synthase [Gordonia sp. NPDC003504]
MTLDPWWKPTRPVAGRSLVITGTSTDVGKTIVTAALAATLDAAGTDVAVCKPAQTGVGPDEPGDLARITALAGDLPTWEGARFPDPLAPETAAHRAGLPQLDINDVVPGVADVVGNHRLTLIEGAGGVLVRLAPGFTILDVARALGSSVLVVTQPGLGALNHAELTVAAVRAAGVDVAGLVIGSWPAAPDLAMRCNRHDLPRLTGVPVVGVLPEGAGAMSGEAFRSAAPTWVDADWITAIRTQATSPQTTLTDDSHLEGIF